MSVKSYFLVSFGLAFGFASSCFGESTHQVNQWVKTLFTYTFDSDRDAAWQAEHAQALDYIHKTDPEQLAADLRGVLKHHGVDTVVGAGAAYLMVLHNIDRAANLARLESAHENSSDDVETSLPDAFADIAIRQHSKEAARFLVAMPNGDYECEMQSIAIHRVFLASPELIVSEVSKSPALRKNFLLLLPFGAWTAEQTMRSAKRIANEHIERAQGAELAIYRKIAQMPDEAK